WVVAQGGNEFTMTLSRASDQAAGAGIADVTARVVVARVLVEGECAGEHGIAFAPEITINVAVDAHGSGLDQRFVLGRLSDAMATQRPGLELAECDARGAGCVPVRLVGEETAG